MKKGLTNKSPQSCGRAPYLVKVYHKELTTLQVRVLDRVSHYGVSNRAAGDSFLSNLVNRLNPRPSLPFTGLPTYIIYNMAPGKSRLFYLIY